MLAVLSPIALIAISIQIGENAKPIGLIQLPITFIHVTRRVYQATVPFAHTMGKLSLINRTVCILDRTHSMPTDLPTAQSRHVYELSLVLITRTIYIIELVQLVRFGLSLQRLCV